MSVTLRATHSPSLTGVWDLLGPAYWLHQLHMWHLRCFEGLKIWKSAIEMQSMYNPTMRRPRQTWHSGDTLLGLGQRWCLGEACTRQEMCFIYSTSTLPDEAPNRWAEKSLKQLRSVHFWSQCEKSCRVFRSVSSSRVRTATHPLACCDSHRQWHALFTHRLKHALIRLVTRELAG